MTDFNVSYLNNLRIKRINYIESLDKDVIENFKKQIDRRARNGFYGISLCGPRRSFKSYLMDIQAVFEEYIHHYCTLYDVLSDNNVDLDTYIQEINTEFDFFRKDVRIPNTKYRIDTSNENNEDDFGLELGLLDIISQRMEMLFLSVITKSSNSRIDFNSKIPCLDIEKVARLSMCLDSIFYGLEFRINMFLDLIKKLTEELQSDVI